MGKIPHEKKPPAQLLRRRSQTPSLKTNGDARVEDGTGSAPRLCMRRPTSLKPVMYTKNNNNNNNNKKKGGKKGAWAHRNSCAP